MTPFSERLGISQPKTIQIANLDMDLRNSLWNVCREYFFIFRTRQLADDDMYHVASKLYKDLYMKPIEALPYDSSKFVEDQLRLFQLEIWYKVLDIVEFLHTLFRDGGPEQRKFERQIGNYVLDVEVPCVSRSCRLS